MLPLVPPAEPSSSLLKMLKKKAKDGPVILLREETSPDDITGMHVAKGVITCRGVDTSARLRVPKLVMP